ncbi:MAG: hypothetical protein ACI9E1_000960 [Cryomorphaceae bacterium]|jgi:hypothetical protein
MHHLLVVSLTCYLAICQFSAAQNPILSKDLAAEVGQQKREVYQKNLTNLQQSRIAQAAAYKNASSEVKKTILSVVKMRLESELCQNVFPAWYGTPWDFNGISKTPGEGKIACGYFVSTCLVHIGFKVSRIRLAQQPSQRIIRTFMERSAMDISSKRALADIKKQLVKSGDGIYIVGLDTHTGFVTVNGEAITFVHSSYYNTPKRCVVSEPYDSKNPLADSKYRVFGKLFHDDMLIKWLHERPYKIAK